MSEKTGSPESNPERNEEEQVHFELSHRQIADLLVAINSELENIGKELISMQKVPTTEWSSQDREDYDNMARMETRLRELQTALSDKLDIRKLNIDD